MATPLAYERDDLGSAAFIDRTVNSVRSGDQLSPDVALTNDDAAVFAWVDDSSSGDGAGNHDVKVRGLSRGGCDGFGDIFANTNTDGDQRSPALASDTNGNFVVAWEDAQDGNGAFQIVARGLDGP